MQVLLNNFRVKPTGFRKSLAEDPGFRIYSLKFNGIETCEEPDGRSGNGLIALLTDS
jgi:hypothetical protein